MSRFAKWLKTCEITVDGEMYEIRPKLKHLNSLMGVISRSQKKTKNNDGEEEQTMIMSDDDADKMGETFLSIMENYSKLDRPEVLSHFFYPQQEARTELPDSAMDFDCKIAENVTLGCRLHIAAKDAPTIFYFHGNAEKVSDYDEIGGQYKQHGMNLLVITYRGYGWSTGTPGVTTMFKDSAVLLKEASSWLEKNGFSGSLFIMGRSLGSAGAIDLTSKNPDTVKGLIIESGFSDTMPITHVLGIDTTATDITEDDCFNNCKKIAQIKLPTLILHGSADAMIPAALAEKIQACSGARNKQFLVIPGAEHNTMITTAGSLYFEAIKKFIDTTCGVTDWRRQRKRRKG